MILLKYLIHTFLKSIKLAIFFKNIKAADDHECVVKIYQIQVRLCI